MSNAERIIRLDTVRARTGLSRSTIYRKMADGTTALYLAAAFGRAQLVQLLVAAGAKVRAHFTLQSSTVEKPGELTNIVDLSIEIEGSNRPAIVAEWVSRQYFEI